MKKTIASLLTACLLLPACATNVPRKMEDSAVLIKVKVHQDPISKKASKKAPIKKDVDGDDDNDNSESIDVIHLDTDANKGKDGWGICSGVYIKSNIVLSAAHCVDVPENVHIKEIWIRKGSEADKAVIVKIDKQADLVLLYTPLQGNPVKFAWSVSRGEDCWVIGNPLGLPNIVTKGIVSQVNFTWAKQKATFIIVDASTLPGNSGGPVLNSHGHLIGILTRSTSMFGEMGAVGLGFAVDLGTIREFLKSN